MQRFTLVASFVALGLLLPASASHAQAPLPPGAVRLPDGGVFLPGAPQGNTTIITGDRYNSPAANQVTPGTQSSYAYYIPGQGWATGTTYIGADGRPHGTAVIPNTTGGTVTVEHFTGAGGSQQGGQPAAGQSNQGRTANLVGTGGPAVMQGNGQPATGGQQAQAAGGILGQRPQVQSGTLPQTGSRPQVQPGVVPQQFGPRPGNQPIGQPIGPRPGVIPAQGGRPIR